MDYQIIYYGPFGKILKAVDTDSDDIREAIAGKPSDCNAAQIVLKPTDTCWIRTPIASWVRGCGTGRDLRFIPYPGMDRNIGGRMQLVTE